MTIPSQDSKNIYTLNESTTSFDYTFKIDASADLLVTRYYTVNGSSATLVLDSDYTVTGVGEEAGGTVVYAGASSYGSDYKLIVLRNKAYLQTTDLINDDYSASFNETLEDTFDSAVMLILQLLEQQTRTLKMDSSIETVNDIPAVSDGYLYWNQDTSSFSIEEVVETILQNYNGSFLSGLDAAKAANPSVNDLYFATDTNIMYGCTVAGSWGYSKNIYDLAVVNDCTIGGDVDVTGDIEITGGLTTLGTITASGAATFNNTVALNEVATIATAKVPIFVADPTISDDKHVATKKYVDDTVTSSTPSFKIGTFTRDLTAATGTVAYSGIGFRPTIVTFWGFVANSVIFSQGRIDNGGNQYNVYMSPTSTWDTVGASFCILAIVSAGNQQSAAYSAVGSDGFSLSWVKTGSPTGTLHVYYLAQK